MRRAALAVALCLAARPASGRELWAGRQGARGEASAFFKTFLTGAWLSPSLVEGTFALQAALDEARALLPPSLAAQVPGEVALPDFVLVNAQVARAWGTARLREGVSLDLAWQLTLLAASDSRFTSGAPLAAPFSSAAGAQRAARRLWDFEPTLLSRAGVRLEHDLDRLALRLALPVGDLIAGRQVLSWGPGRFWNPTDVLSPFPPTALDREVRRGFDGLRLALSLGEVTQLDLVFLPQAVAADVGGVARFQTNLRGWDGALSFGKYGRDLVAGLDVVGDVGPVAAHFEGAYTAALDHLDTPGLPVEVGEHFFRGVWGLDYKPTDELVLMLEYHFNGAGTLDPSAYVARLQSARALRGELFGAGVHYAALAASYRATELLGLSALLLANLTDPSLLVAPSLEYSLEQSVLLRAGATIPLGASPDASVFRGLSAHDVLGSSARFTRARDTLGLRSEYGAQGFSVFLQVGLYAL